MAITATTPDPVLATKSRPSAGLVSAVEFLRGDTVESIHYAAVAVVDHDGQLIASLGDPDFVTFSRSSLKPMQALPTVVRGYPERFGLTERHLALACASHSGEDRHVRAAQEMLAAIGATVEDLQCGTQIPIRYRADEGAIPAKSEFSAIYNNCSGKHSTMLALARILDVPLTDYLKYDAPVQREIRRLLSEVTGVTEGDMPWAVDGCSAPNYALPLSALARGFARYAWSASQPENALNDWQRAAAKIARAMMNYPEMISGIGRFDLQLVEATGKTIFAKTGGEALECVGIPSKGWGVTLKIADGGMRAIPPLMISVLDQLGVLSADARDRLESIARPKVKNVRGLDVGEARCVAELKRYRM